MKILEEKIIVAKIGGSISIGDDRLDNTISQFQELLNKDFLKNIILISGGGTYATFVRKADRAINLGEDFSHWLAIFAMDYNAFYIAIKSWAKGYKNVFYVPNFEILHEKLENHAHQILILGSFDDLYKEDPLPHNWDVTSDSITYYFAMTFHLNRCFLIKDIDGIYDYEKNLIRQISTDDFRKLKKENLLYYPPKEEMNTKKSQPVDSYLLDLIDKHKKPCYILNGKSKSNRILEFFSNKKSKEKYYTKIKP